MTSGNAWRDEKRARRVLSELNHRTSALYNACRGHHTPSGDTVTRHFPIGERTIPICANCGCPYGGPKSQWTSNASGGRA